MVVDRAKLIGVFESWEVMNFIKNYYHGKLVITIFDFSLEIGKRKLKKLRNFFPL